MASTFTRDGITYTGFRSYYNRPLPSVGELLVVVWFEGDPELWICDNQEGVEDLKKYWRSEWPDHPLDVTISVVSVATSF